MKLEYFSQHETVGYLWFKKFKWLRVIPTKHKMCEYCMDINCVFPIYGKLGVYDMYLIKQFRKSTFLNLFNIDCVIDKGEFKI